MQSNHLRPPAAFRPDLSKGAMPRTSDDARGLCPPVSRVGRVTLRAEPRGDDGDAKAAAMRDPDQESILGGRGNSSGGWGPDGGALRPARGRGDDQAPNFNIDVPPNGYAWWYIDGFDPQTGRAISIIAFIGSVFSPWYKWSGRKEPQNNVCLNVATYGPGGRFTMTDRGRAALGQTQHSLTIGPSSVTWDDTEKCLRIKIDEISSLPLISRIRGTVTLRPKGITQVELPLTAQGTHIWRPFAPSADIDVDLDMPGWTWSGHGYFDANFGTRALEQDFNYWTWARFPVQGGAKCFYDLELRDGTHEQHALHFDTQGIGQQIKAPPPPTKFSRSLWAVARNTRCDQGKRPKQVKSLLDAPFYSRAMVETTLLGETTTGVFEALDLHRFRNPAILAMLAVRVPRRASWPGSITPED
jgi:carotenoid 1,2-hydratase